MINLFSDSTHYQQFQDKVIKPEDRLTVYLFTILGISFFVVGLRLIQNLKLHHIDFYN